LPRFFARLKGGSDAALFRFEVSQMNHNRLVIFLSAAVIFLAGALAYGTLQPSGAQTSAAPLRLPPRRFRRR
jgi:hypothetical protein